MTKFTGKCSSFGGLCDSGMKHNEDLSLYWTQEQCQQRPDLFYNTLGTSKYLRDDAFYIAVRFDVEMKEELRNSKWKVTNPKNKKFCFCTLTDWGPNANTGRVVDISPKALMELDLDTDDEIDVELVTSV